MRLRSIRAQLGLPVFAVLVAAQVLAASIFTDERAAAIRAAQQGETAERTLAPSDMPQAGPAEVRALSEATLVHARGVSPDRPSAPADLEAMQRDLGAELSGTGPAISAQAEPAVASLRRTAMRRALRNLMENAQRYGGGECAVPTVAGEIMRIAMDDDGPGAPAADLERALQPFVRLKASRSLETGGTGLALPIARAIQRAQGGDVTLANRPEGGLRACVTQPALSEA